jgi:hypothetical protein
MILRVSLITSLMAAVLMPAPAFANASSGGSDWLSQASQQRINEFDGTEVPRKTGDDENTRGKVTIRRIKPQCKSDCDNDQTALPYFFYQLKMRTNSQYPCYVNNEGISLTGDEIFDYPIIYFTSHHAFDFSEAEVENLKKYLARGGTL